MGVFIKFLRTARTQQNYITVLHRSHDSFLHFKATCQQLWPLHLEYHSLDLLYNNSNSNTQLHITYPHIHLSPTYHLAITYLLLIPIRYVTQQISSPLWSVPLHRELLLVLESQKIWPKLEPRKRLGSLK